MADTRAAASLLAAMNGAKEASNAAGIAARNRLKKLKNLRQKDPPQVPNLPSTPQRVSSVSPSHSAIAAVTAPAERALGPVRRSTSEPVQHAPAERALGHVRRSTSEPVQHAPAAPVSVSIARAAKDAMAERNAISARAARAARAAGDAMAATAARAARASRAYNVSKKAFRAAGTASKNAGRDALIAARRAATAEENRYIIVIAAIIVVFICTILTLHLVYKLSFDIEIMYRTERACEPEQEFVRGDQGPAPSWYARYYDPYRPVLAKRSKGESMEEETFRHQLYRYNTSHVGLATTIKVLSISALIVLLVLLKYREKKDPVLPLVIPTIATVGLILNIFVYKPVLTNAKYASEYEAVREAVRKIFEDGFGPADKKTLFIGKGLIESRVFDDLFIRGFIDRWKSKYNTDSIVDQYNEVVFTDKERIKEIENVLFIKENDKIIGMNADAPDIIVGMLRAEKVAYRVNGEVVRKRDLDFIYDAHRNWACKKKTASSKLQTECDKGGAYPKPHLPEPTEHNTYDEISKQLFTFKLTSFVILIVFMFTPFHYAYQSKAMVQIFITAFIVIVLAIFFIYIMSIQSQL